MSEDKPKPPRGGGEHGHDSQFVLAEPIPDPGIEPHELRITDIDPKAADRVERQVSTMFGLAGLLFLGSCVALLRDPAGLGTGVRPAVGQREQPRPSGLCLGLGCS